jgi:hypothetical protein
MEYLTIARDYLLLLLDAPQWHILALIVLVTSGATESVKRLLTSTGKKRDRTIYAASLAFGLLSTVAGYFVAIKVQPMWFWLTTGVMAGPVTSWLYRYTMPVIKYLTNRWAK